MSILIPRRLEPNWRALLGPNGVTTVTLPVQGASGDRTTLRVLLADRDYDVPLVIWDLDGTQRLANWKEVLWGLPAFAPDTQAMMKEVVDQQIPMLVLTYGTDRAREQNEHFFQRSPLETPPVLLDRTDPIHQVNWQTRYKLAQIGSIKAAIPRARVVGVGDTAHGVQAFLRELPPRVLPPNFEGSLSPTFDPEVVERFSQVLKASRAESISWGGVPRPLTSMALFSAALDRHSGAKAIPGNRVEVVVGGEAIYQRRLERISRAQKEIRLVTFEWDETGRSAFLAGELVRAAKERGVRLEALVDAAGVRHAPQIGRPFPIVQALEAVSDQPVSFSPLIRPSEVWDFHRTHEKITFIDGAWAEVSSCNMVDAGMGADRHIEASYLALDALANVSINAHILYPVTDEQLHSWIAAAQRGVDVRIFTGDAYELVQRVTRDQLTQAVRAGVKVFLTRGRVHDKGRSWDHSVLSISSYNGDNVGDRNYEIAALVEDPKTTQLYEEQAFTLDANGRLAGFHTTQVQGQITPARWQRWADGLVGVLFPKTYR